MMKMKIWGFPWLCLCLIFSVPLTSCAIKHKVDGVQKQPLNNNREQGWDMKVVCAANYIPFESTLIVQPFQIKMIGQGDTNLLLMSFYLINERQMQLLSEQLLASGTVYQIYINERK